jgi:hypothetical protein
MSKDSNVAGGNDKSSQNPFGFISDFFEQAGKVISEFFQSVFNFFSGDSAGGVNNEANKKEERRGARGEESPANEYTVSPRNLLSQFKATSQSLESSQTVQQGEPAIIGKSAYKVVSDIDNEELRLLEESFKNQSISFVENPEKSQKYTLTLVSNLDQSCRSLIYPQFLGSSQIQQDEPVINESSASEGIPEAEVTKVFYKIFTEHNREYTNIDDFINRFAGGVIEKNHGEWLPSELKKFHQNYESSSAKINPTTAPNSPTPSLPNSRDSGGQRQ